MTQKILDFIGMKNNRIFYDRFHLKLNLENHQHVNGMFYILSLTQYLLKRTKTKFILYLKKQNIYAGI